MKYEIKEFEKIVDYEGTPREGTVYTIDFKEQRGHVQVVLGIWVGNDDPDLYYVGIGRAKWQPKTKKWKHTKQTAYNCPLNPDFPKKYERKTQYVADYITEKTGIEIALAKSGLQTLEDLLNFRT